PPVGLGPVWGYTLWPFIAANAAAQTASIMAVNTKGFAQGGILEPGKAGIFEGTHREIVAPEKDFISVVNDLVAKSQIAIAGGYYSGGSSINSSPLINKIDELNENIKRLAERPARAYLDNDEEIKIGDHYDYEMRRSLG
ncbi:MAG: hypothetical protein GYA14_04180, partial [Ignavibacteria bacterium]|nr:hypothetical protein [Ignavibacteria bacterium]